MTTQVRRRDFAVGLARRSVSEFLEDHCSQLAASIAYHVLFSLFPLVIVLVGAASLVVNASGSRAALVHTIVHHLPLSVGGKKELHSLLLGTTSGTAGLGLIAIVGLLYSASGMMAALRLALNQAWDVETPRPFLKGKIVDFGLVFVVATVGLGSLGLTIATRFLTTTTGLPGWAAWLASVFVPLVVAFAVTLFLYRVVPAAEVRLAHAWPAALIVAVLLVAAQNLFAVYVGNFAHYNAVYGSLGAVVAFMFFVYLAATIFLFGAEIASEWPRVRYALDQESAPSAGPPLAVQIRRAARGLWLRPHTNDHSRDEDRSTPRSPGKGARDPAFDPVRRRTLGR